MLAWDDLSWIGVGRWYGGAEVDAKVWPSMTDRPADSLADAHEAAYRPAMTTVPRPAPPAAALRAALPDALLR